MNLVTSLFVVSQVVALAFALSITATSYRTYRRTGDRAFRYTVAGFGMLVLGLGLGLGSSLLYSVSIPLTELHIVQSAVFAIGFVVLYHSINGCRGSVER